MSFKSSLLSLLHIKQDKNSQWISHLLGSTKNLTDSERLLYNQVLLCKQTTTSLTETKSQKAVGDFQVKSHSSEVCSAPAEQGENCSSLDPQNPSSAALYQDVENASVSRSRSLTIEGNSIELTVNSGSVFGSSSSSHDISIHNEKDIITNSYSHKQQQVKLYTPILPLPAPVHRQSFNQWKAVLDLGFKMRHYKKRRTIYLQPLDDFPDFITNFRLQDGSSFFELLKKVAEVFFGGFQVNLRPALDTQEAGWQIKSRYHKVTQKKQHLVGDVITNLRTILPSDGCCILGISWTDLYPTEDLNFVLGEAVAGKFAAAFCFGRYEPKKFVNGNVPPALDKIDGYIIWRMIKVITHETCHLFGMSHCVFFQCLMNESTSMHEAMIQPLFLCPVCLRKMQYLAKFSVVERYQKMLKFLSQLYVEYPSDYLSTAIDWLCKCLHYIQD